MGAGTIYNVLLIGERPGSPGRYVVSHPMSKKPLHLGQRMLVARSSSRARSRQFGHTP